MMVLRSVNEHENICYTSGCKLCDVIGVNTQ